MSLTISQILACDGATPEIAGITFDELARAVDDRHDDLVGMLRDLEDVWEAGEGRTAALEAGVALRQEILTAQAALVGTGPALREFASGARALAALLSQTVNEARAHGVGVADDGTVMSI
ncbi:MAG: hypothetical protein HKP61_04995 [Dactylosporangium sp.]|nr:hypothetical protein [Dactylosporangium sp.]NNJ60303.1 hypothetical protein [Dactylosporangium sp.]